LKSAISLSDSILSFESTNSLEEQQKEKKRLDTRLKLREQLMKDCLGAIESRQKQVREQLMISVDEQELRKDFDNLLKQSIKKHVMKSPIEIMKCNDLNSSPGASDKQGSEKKKKPSTSKNQKKVLTATTLSDETASNSLLEINSHGNFQQGRDEKIGTENLSTKTEAADAKKTHTKNKTPTKPDRLNFPNSSKPSSGSNLSSSTEHFFEELQNEKEGGTKRYTTRTPMSSAKNNSLKSNSSPTTFDKQGSDKEKKSTNESQRKLSTTTLTALSDETSDNSTSEIKSPGNCQQDNAEKIDMENMSSDTKSGWRKTVSNIISAGRLRSRSLGRSTSRLRPLRKTRSFPKSSTNSGKRSDIKKETSQKDDTSDILNAEDDSNLRWHCAMMKHDWDVIRTMLKSYDHTKYRQRSNSIGRLRYPEVRQAISPLLQVDEKGRTPLHLACKERMPSRLLRRLLFVERSAASIQDNDGRYPLHLVVMNSLDQHILDRVIHASPDSLGAPDHLNHTPIQYAVLKADRCRENKEIFWGAPKTKDQGERQNLQTDAYQSVVFILESMVKRRKALSIVHEKQTLIEALELFAPPEVVDLMVILSEKILCNDQNMSHLLVDMVFERNYPLNVVHRVLETTSKIIPASNLLETVRRRLTDHFTKGCISTALKESKGGKVTTSLAKQFAKSCQRGHQKEGKNSSCKDWWDKLRYLIARSCNRTSNWKNDTVLHMALCNPKSQPSLIEYLCRLNPSARYKRDEVTGALPIHLACMYWHAEKCGIGSESSHKKVLNLLLAGDFELVRRACHGRIALHYATLNGKSMSYVQSLLNLNQETTSIRDPVTKLLPFQLAATSERYNDNKSTQQLNIIYSLLRANPFVLSTPHEIIDPRSEMNALTRHVLCSTRHELKMEIESKTKKIYSSSY